MSFEDVFHALALSDEKSG